MNTMTLTPGQLSLSQLYDVWRHPVQLRLDASAIDGINASVACVNDIVAEGRTAYGINTGFGLLARTRIADEDLQNLQRSLVLSHAAGVGDPLDDAMVRLIMVLKINSPGARVFRDSVERDRGAHRSGECRRVSADSGKRVGWRVGRLSASGASVADATWRRKSALAGRMASGAGGAKKAGLEPVALAAKEGLALLNGTRASTASRCAVCLRHRNYLPPPSSAAR